MLLGGATVFSILGHFCIIDALHHVEPTVVSGMRTLEIIMAFVLQIVVFKEQPSLLGVLGALFVMVGVFFIPFEGWLDKKAMLPWQRKKAIS